MTFVTGNVMHMLGGVGGCYWLRISSRAFNSVPLSYLKVAPPNVDQIKSPILVFHGLFGSKTNWKSISNQLAKRSNRVVYSFDLRNHGDSPHVAGSESDLYTMASDIGLFLHQNKVKQALLLGHSLGGRVASQFAFISPIQVEKLILVDISPLKTVPKIDFLTDSLFDTLRQSVQNLPPNTDLTKARKVVGEQLIKSIKDKFIVDFFLLSLYKDQQGVIKWKFNVDALQYLVEQKVVHNIEVVQPYKGPTLLIHGEKSNYVRSQDYDQIRQLMPNAKFVSIANAGHYLHIEKTNEFIEHVLQFFV